jgi:hypothetical protein
MRRTSSTNTVPPATSSPSFPSAGTTTTEPHRRLGQAQKSSVVKNLLAQLVLFGFGVGYGALVAHLHDNRQMAPINVPPSVSALDSTTTLLYLVFWGFAGVGMGNLLPWVDSRSQRKTQTARLLHSVGWHDVVRSIGAFVGIAFAIVSFSPSFFLILELKRKKTGANIYILFCSVD